jgi:hypothetical protein
MPARVIETTSLPEDLPPPNGMFGLFNDIIALNENLHCTVVMNHLRTCHGYAILKKMFQLEDGNVT